MIYSFTWNRFPIKICDWFLAYFTCEITWKQPIMKWAQHVISVVACCHSAKLFAIDTQTLQLPQNGAVTRMWKQCQIRPLQKKCAIGVVWCKKEGMLLKTRAPWCSMCAIVQSTTNRICAKNCTYMYMVQASEHGMWSPLLLATTVRSFAC